MTPEMKKMCEAACRDFDKKLLNALIEKIIEDKTTTLNLKQIFPQYSPNDIISLLEESGWDAEWDGDNGWEQDTWYSLSHEKYEDTLTLSYSGYYWTMSLYVSY